MSQARKSAEQGFWCLGFGLAAATPLGAVVARGATGILGWFGYRYGLVLS